MTDDQTLYAGPGKLYMRPLTETDKRPDDWQEIGHASGWTLAEAEAWPQRWATAFESLIRPWQQTVTFTLINHDPRLLRLYFGGNVPRTPRAVRHPDMASKPHVPVKPSARSRRRTR